MIGSLLQSVICQATKALPSKLVVRIDLVKGSQLVVQGLIQYHQTRVKCLEPDLLLGVVNGLNNYSQESSSDSS